MEESLYTYRAEVVRVIDGDTIVINLDLGLSIWSKNLTVRLYGINSPEIRGAERPEGLKSKEWLVKTLSTTPTIIVKTYKDKNDKYGRLLADIYIGDRYINDEIVEEGFAKLASY